MKYIVLIHKDPDSDFGITVPDLPGCFSAGDSLESALVNAEEAILTHVEGLLIDNEPIPEPSSYDEILKLSKKEKATLAVVTVDFTKIAGRSKRINITIPERLLSKFDSFAKKEGETRSGFLVHAAMDYINSHG
jgi:predicted RNase H-like HicB family nuclease